MFIRRCITSAVIAASFILPACDSKQENPVNTYLGARQSASNAADAANLDALKKSIEAYRAANGSYPQSLRDVEGMLGSQLDFSRYDYDPQTGRVSLKPQ